MAIIIPCLVILLAVAWSMKLYEMGRSEATTKVIWHDNEAFIVVGIDTRGWSGSYLRMLGQIVRDNLSPWGAGYVSLRPDMILYHFDGQRFQRHELQGMSASSGFVPFEGVLHRTTGRSAEGATWVWRWTGSKFQPLTNEEEQKFRAAGMRDEMYKREGWSEESLTPFQGTERIFPIKLKDQELVVTLVKPNGDTPAAQRSEKWLRISVSGTNLPETVLYEFDQRWRRVDRNTYREFAKVPEGADGLMMRPPGNGSYKAHQ